MNHGFVSTGWPIGGCPQSGGHTKRGTLGAASTAAVIDAATATAIPAPTVVSSRACEVVCAGTASYGPGGNAYPGRVTPVPAALRRARDVRDAALAATPQLGQNAELGTTWSQCGHNT